MEQFIKVSKTKLKENLTEFRRELDEERFLNDYYKGKLSGKIASIESILSESTPIEESSNSESYRWVKASERLPEHHMPVIIRDLKNSLVTTAHKNYDEKEPMFYFVLGSYSFLAVPGDGNFRSTYPVENIEWLDENATPIESKQPTGISDEEIEKMAVKELPTNPIYADALESLSWQGYIYHLRLQWISGYKAALKK